MSPPPTGELEELLSQWTAPALIDHLLSDASGGSYRIRRREAIHQLMNLLPTLPDAQQVSALRRLRQLPGRSVFNLHVCTSQLHLISTLLKRLHPEAAAPSAAVREELVGLLSTLGSHRASSDELRALFQLVRMGLRRGTSAGAPPSAHASPEVLLQLLLNWCTVHTSDNTDELEPPPPRSYFDVGYVDDLGGGILLAPSLAQELIA